MLELDLEHRAVKFVEKLPLKQRGQIFRKLETLCEDPYAPDCKPLHGYAFLRADIGEYRIVYRVEYPFLHVFLIGKRNDDDVYKRLKRIAE